MLQDLMTPTWRPVQIDFTSGGSGSATLTLDSQYGICVQNINARVYASDGTNPNFLDYTLKDNDIFTIAVSGQGGTNFTGNSSVDLYGWVEAMNSDTKPSNLWFLPKSTTYTFTVTHSAMSLTANYTASMRVNLTIYGVQTTAETYVEFLQQQKYFALKVNEPFIPKR